MKARKVELLFMWVNSIGQGKRAAKKKKNVMVFPNIPSATLPLLYINHDSIPNRPTLIKIESPWTFLMSEYGTSVQVQQPHEVTQKWIN